MAEFCYFRSMISRFTLVVGMVCTMLALSFTEPEAKPMLIIFTGSDWCANCRYLEKMVLRDSVFVHFASENTNLIIADFPQQNKQPDEIITRNDSLAFLYNKDGVYPKLVLVQGEKATLIPYHRQRSPELIDELRKQLSQ